MKQEVEVDPIQINENDKMEDANDAPVSGSSSLIGLNDDEFFDIPEESDKNKPHSDTV